MSELVKPALSTSEPNFQHLLLHQRRHTNRCGKSMLAGSEPTYESAAFVSGRAISRSLHRLVRVDMDRSSLLRRKIPGKFAR
jgi:hypothetical protein